MSRPRLVVTRPLAPPCVARITNAADAWFWPEDRPIPRDILLREVASADGLLCMITERIDAELLDCALNLKVVSNIAVGVDNIDLAACAKRGIAVGNTPDVLSGATADVAFALILATARRLVEGHHYVHDGDWKTWQLHGMLGQEVHGATLGIIGLGRIGSEVAKRARGFDMRVIYCNRNHVADTTATYVDFDTLLRESDFVSIHCPLSDATRGLIGARELGLMKPSAILINSARGPIVDQAALYDALKDRRIWAAGLDVFEVEPLPTDHPLLTLPNLVVTPHIGSATEKTRLKMMELATENALAGVRGDPLPHRV